MLATAVIFDLDGTLIDTESIYMEAAEEILRPHGITYGPREHREFLRKNTWTAGADLIRDTPLSLDSFNARRREIVMSRSSEAADVLGAAAFLEVVSGMGCEIGLATNSPANECSAKIANRAWRKDIRAVVCGDDPRVREVKPAPNVYFACAEDLGVNPSECLVFEDSPFGVESALRAGMRVVAIQGPYVDARDLDGAEKIFNDFRDALEDLEQLRVK